MIQGCKGPLEDMRNVLRKGGITWSLKFGWNSLLPGLLKTARGRVAEYPAVLLAIARLKLLMPIVKPAQNAQIEVADP
jgi:hypothetical protein